MDSMLQLPESTRAALAAHEAGMHKNPQIRSKKDVDRACHEGRVLVLQGYRGEVSRFNLKMVVGFSGLLFLMAFGLDPANLPRNALVLLVVTSLFVLATLKFGSRRQRDARKLLLVVGPDGVFGRIQTLEEGRLARRVFEDRFVPWEEVTTIKETLELVSGAGQIVNTTTYEIRHRRKQREDIIDQMGKYRSYMWKVVVNPRTATEVPFDITHVRREDFPEPHHEFLVADLIYRYWKMGRNRGE
ncbi:MAG: hypothetical protein ACTSU5_14715 [Promethearchaeota archaeon]